ncbi:hypothetical protein GGI15_003838 [Coemansia interrupta]|uniref:RING-type domain-containing protein n=1 Tax=Coemansia interrupta TaxID=1126814 RepID=A0A9W8HC98_9FUNG|nr:hypothetical protein GGI15_003838 [Coemansia interrupta]
MSLQEYSTHGCTGLASIVQQSKAAGKMPHSTTASAASSESGSLRRSGRKRSQPVLYTYSAEEQAGERSAQSRTRKRRQTGRSRTSSRERSSEGTISSGPKCPVCQKHVNSDVQEINEHIDRCLASMSTDDRGTEASVSDRAPVVEYEWSGQTRVRATALFEGGLSKELGTNRMAHVERDEDVDVDAEDERSFGSAQYSDADLLFGSTKGGRMFVGAAPMWEEQPMPLDDVQVARESHAQDAARGVAGGSIEAMQLVVDSLRARIREQDKLIRSTKHCTICLEAYSKPCVSVNCWHVYCEGCWLRTLGTKKLCPQCLQITQPTDLRRIYM